MTENKCLKCSGEWCNLCDYYPQEEGEEVIININTAPIAITIS
jgi:hypothetical protein